jgi:hypothetical protein
VAHPWSDFSQSPSLNDQRRISTTEPPIGVDVKVELSAPPPDAASQPAPVDPTTLVLSAKSFELMRQLEALSHEIALISTGDSSNQCIKVQEGSNSAGLHTVEPSIRVSARDQLASYRPSIGRRTFLTLANFFIAARDQLASYRPSIGRRTFLTLANFFIAARDQLASYRPSIGRRTFLTLANFFVAARDQLASYRPSIDRLNIPHSGYFHSDSDRCRSHVCLAVSACLDREVAERRRRCRRAIRRYACRSAAAAKFVTATSACHSDCTSAHRARSRRARAARCQARTD